MRFVACVKSFTCDLALILFGLCRMFRLHLRLRFAWELLNCMICFCNTVILVLLCFNFYYFAYV